MILTITPNTALDKVLFVEHFAFGETVRASAAVDGMGGKGAVTSWVLGQLGTPNLATGLAAGETGRRMEAVLRAAGVHTDFVWVDGETRTNYVIARSADGTQGTITVAGLRARPEDGERLRAHVVQLLDQADFLLCGGTMPQGLPPDWYVPIIHLAKERHIPTLLDASHPFLGANISALPDVIKPNEAEATALLGQPVHTVAQAAEAARILRARGIGVPMITLGALGAVVGLEEGVVYIPPLPVRVVNTAGAGDAFNAGLMQARTCGESWEEALRWAAAVATAALLTPATGEVHLEDVQRLHPQVRLERVG